MHIKCRRQQAAKTGVSKEAALKEKHRKESISVEAKIDRLKQKG